MTDLQPIKFELGGTTLFDGVPTRFSVHIESAGGNLTLEMGPPKGPGLLEQMMGGTAKNQRRNNGQQPAQVEAEKATPTP